MRLISRLKREEKAETAVHILICFIIGIYPLLLFDFDLGNFYIQQFILFLCTMGALLYCFLLIRTGEWKLSICQSRTDFVVLALIIYVFLNLIMKMINTDKAEAVRFDSEITILVLAVLYFLITARPVFKAMYFDILLFAGLIVFMLLLAEYLFGEGTNTGLAILVQDKSGIASYTLLVCMAGLWQYLKCKDRLRSVFYIGVLTVGFLIMFINQNRICIWLMIMVFLVIPVLQRPTAELVKKNMQMFFLYLFMLSNMSLLTGYTKLLQGKVSYDFQQSVYLELLTAVGGIFFFKYWDRIPEGIDLRRLVMRKMRRGYQFLFRLLSITFIGILLGGEHWKELPDRTGMNAVKEFSVPLVEELQKKSAFYLCFEQLGLIGGILILTLCVFLIAKLRKVCGFEKPVTSMLVLISSVFMIQLLFWNVSINTLPVYWIFMVLAITYREEKEKVISNKVKFE